MTKDYLNLLKESLNILLDVIYEIDEGKITTGETTLRYKLVTVQNLLRAINEKEMKDLILMEEQNKPHTLNFEYSTSNKLPLQNDLPNNQKISSIRGIKEIHYDGFSFRVTFNPNAAGTE